MHSNLKKGYEERVALLEHLKVDRRKEVANGRTGNLERYDEPAACSRN